MALPKEKLQDGINAIERLLDLETMTGDEFRKLISEYTIIPPKREYKPKLIR